MRFVPSTFREGGIKTAFGNLEGVRSRGERIKPTGRRGVKIGGTAQKTTQNSASSIDNTSQGRTAGIWDAGQKAAQAGDPLAAQAGQTLSGYQTAGTTGANALGGDPNAVKQLMNPYTSQVIDANNSLWQKENQQTLNTTDDAAQKAGAFGGSRHGVAEGVALANNNLQQANQNAGLLSAGYNGAIQQAGTAANLGFGAATANQNALTPEERALQATRAGYVGPNGQTSSGAQTSANVGIGFGIG